VPGIEKMPSRSIEPANATAPGGGPKTDAASRFLNFQQGIDNVARKALADFPLGPGPLFQLPEPAVLCAKPVGPILGFQNGTYKIGGAFGRKPQGTPHLTVAMGRSILGTHPQSAGPVPCHGVHRGVRQSIREPIDSQRRVERKPSIVRVHAQGWICCRQQKSPRHPYCPCQPHHPGPI